MRALGVAAALALTLTVGGVAVADDQTPTKKDVHDARVAVRHKADDVAEVRARLVLANQRLQQSSIAAAKAAEAFNGARWRAAEARKAAAAAERRSAIAGADVRRQRAAYGDALVRSYELSPGLTTLAAMVRSDGIDTVIDKATTLRNAESVMDSNYDSFRASKTLADVATSQAQDARDAAVRAEQEAKEARQAARDAADAAAAQASSIAHEKDALLKQLARLQHISVRLAQKRQADLEAKAAAAAAAAAQHEQEEQEKQQQAQEQQEQQQQAQGDPTPSSTPSAPTPAPAPASGAQAAIAFARAQIGEPYRWGAAGPDAWDCSGLTMGAWAAAGRSLPHYSVAQYEQSTPISPSQLQPGDLVFWGSSSDPSSIYHVALYVGGGMIIEAPRTGYTVTEESMYAWITPNFYARP